MTTVLLVIIAVLVFGFIVFAHEFGHFFTAKLSGIKVNEFALGMGPKLFSFGKKETKYSLRLFPIGGFCAMEGEDEDSEDSRAFNNKPVWKRIIVVVFGAVMNIVLGFLIMLIILAQEPQFATTTISKFTDGAATQAAGLQAGDTFYSVDGIKILSDRDLSFALALADPDGVDIVVLREGKKVSFPSVRFNTVQSEGTEVLSLDFYVLPQDKTFGTLLAKTGKDTISVVKMVWISLSGLVTGRFGLNDVAGPIGAAQAITQAASVGLQTGFANALNNILLMMAIITVNLGIVNLLPLPALDGGRLLFLVIEGIFRKPIPRKYEGWVHASGFFVLIAFMVVIAFNDIVRLITGSGIGG